MADKVIKRIDSSPEICALLHSFLRKLEADTVVLYKYIDADDIEGSEILDLISKSSVATKNNDFYHNVIKRDCFGNRVELKELVDKYKEGRLDPSDPQTFDCLEKLKKYVGVLRFCDLSEKTSDHPRWNFDYKRRPPKYLVFFSEILRAKYHRQPIKHEGVTAYFCRTSGHSYPRNKSDAPDVDGKSREQEERIEGSKTDRLHILLNRKEINSNYAHSDFGKDSTVFSINESHHCGWMLLEDYSISCEAVSGPKGERRGFGCLRFEYYNTPDHPADPDKQIDLKDRYLPLFQKMAIEPIVDLTVTEIISVLKKQKKLSYSGQYNCLDPFLEKLQSIGNYLRGRIAALKNEEGAQYDAIKALEEEYSRVRESVIRYEAGHYEEDSINSRAREECYAELRDRSAELDRARREEHDPSSEIGGIKRQLDEYATLMKGHLLIEHLFYVFKRNTYYGEEILNRVNMFIGDMLAVLGLPSEIFGNVWAGLQRHEDLMLYNLDNYRDHFMHQFHVFILGYCMIYSHGINRMTAMLNRRYGELHLCRESAQGAVGDGRDAEAPFLQTDIMRLWALTALFHDCGYAFEKLGSGFDKFSGPILGEKLEPTFRWEKIFLGSSAISSEFRRISKHYVPCQKSPAGIDSGYLHHELTKKATLENDHGVISAAILMQQYERHASGHKLTKNIDMLVSIAGLAIAIHNRPVFEEVKKAECHGICFELNPWAFLLAYCDFAQEWGRKKTVADESERLVVPRLKALNFPMITTEDKDPPDIQEYEVVLEYPADFEGRLQDEHQLRKILSSFKSSFISPSGVNFKIKYNVRDSMGRCIPFKVSVCGDQCPHRVS